MAHVCKICGKLENNEWVEECAKELEAHQMCFECNHWREQHELDITVRGDHKYAVVNGEHYVLAPHTNSYFKGFGGKKFTFKFNDGATVQCDNVLYQGDVKRAHPHWREVLQDNAKIMG